MRSAPCLRGVLAGLLAVMVFVGPPDSLAQTKAQPAATEVPPLTVIAGKPRDRGLAYGKKFSEGIRRFLDQEIYAAFIQKPAPKDDMLRYAGACAKVIREV